MKTIKFLSILFFITIITSCSSNNSSSTSSNLIAGQWKLVYVNGSFAGVSNHFEPGIITWTFNPTTQMVTVVNNNTNDNLLDVFKTGVYNYQITNNSNPSLCSETLKINNMEMGCFSIANNTLRIDQTFTDGFGVTLVH